MSKDKFKPNKLLHKKKNRIWELDFIRGFCVLLMVWDHLMYNFAFEFGPAWGNESVTEFALGYWDGGLRTFFHPIIFCTFFVICGISCTLSHDNMSRGIKALILSLLITLCTAIFEEVSGFSALIKFGVLHMLSFAILIYAIIDILCGHKQRRTSIACLLIGLAILITNLTYLEHPLDNPPEGLQFVAEWLSYGYYHSADYFPLIPNVGYVLIGASIGGYIYRDRKSLLPSLDRYGWYKPIGFWGKMALPVYILHQPVLMGILSLISYLIVTPGDWIIF